MVMTSFTATVSQGDENAARLFRKTPHPSKQLLQNQRPHLGSNDSCNANLFAAEDDDDVYGEDENTFSQGKRLRNTADGMTSDPNLQQMPLAKKFAVGTDSDLVAVDLDEIMDVDDEEVTEQENEDRSTVDDEAAKHKGEEEAHEEWKRVCEHLLNEPEDSKHRQNLEIVLIGMQRREVAQAALEKAYTVASTSLDIILKNILACAIPIHEKVYDKMLLAEQDLLHHFGSNHTVRQAVLQTLESYNEQWQRKYEGYMSRILPGGDDKTSPPDSIQGKLALSSSNDPKANAAKDMSKDHPDEEDAEEEEDAVPEPDWEELLEFDPSSRDKIEAFLSGRDRWQAACQHFSNALDEIHEQLKLRHTNILQAIEEAYSRICGDLDEQQADIQTKIVSNFQRREQLEKALEEAVKQQQSIFARLMARVSGAGAGGGGVRANAAKAKSTGGGSLLSVDSFSQVFQRGNAYTKP